MNKRDTTFAITYAIGLLASLYFLVISIMNYMGQTIPVSDRLNILIHGLSTAAILTMGMLYITARKAVKINKK